MVFLIPPRRDYGVIKLCVIGCALWFLVPMIYSHYRAKKAESKWNKTNIYALQCVSGSLFAIGGLIKSVFRNKVSK